MPEQVTVIITETTPGGGSRFYQEPGHPSSVDVDSLTPNTEYRADAEYETPDGTTIQASNSMTFRTLPVGMFSISNPNWQNDNDGQHSTFTFDYTSTYALSYAQVVDMATGVTYQGTIVGSSVIAQLPAGTAGTQHNFQLIIADIYGYSYVQGYVMTLQASAAGTPLYLELNDVSSPGTVALNKTGTPYSLTMQTSYDNQTWANYTFGDTISLDSTHPRVYFKNSSITRLFSTSSSNYYSFSTTTNINVGGNIASLKSNDLSSTEPRSYDFYSLFKNTLVKNIDRITLINYSTLNPGSSAYFYAYMFSGCTQLSSIPSGLLPATTLSGNCYAYMFSGCTQLSSIPSGLLPATTLAYNCYSGMFSDCTSLTTVPNDLLPATTLDNICYARMFQGCTSLRNMPTLPALEVPSRAYAHMFLECTSLTQIVNLPATTVGAGGYHQMFKGCTSLTTMPNISAVNLGGAYFAGSSFQYSCCSEMFRDCTSLTTISPLPATTLNDYCYYHMFQGCTSLTTIPSGLLPATILASGCYTNMFEGCTQLSSVPNDLLPATTATYHCYYSMFYGCTSLTQAPALPATTLDQSCYYAMFSRCSNLLKSPILPAVRLTESCYGYMFQGCTSLKEITCLAENISATDCTKLWVNGVASTGTFYKSPNMSSWRTGTYGIPTNWTVVDYQN